MNFSTTPSLCERIADTLAEPQWAGVSPKQEADFVGLNGLPEWVLDNIGRLGTGELQATLERLANDRDPEATIRKWRAAREREASELTQTPEEVLVTGRKWLL